MCKLHWNRVFHDRLIDDSDRDWFKCLIDTTVKDSFGLEFAKIRGDHDNLIFCNFGDPKSITKPYAELSDRSNLVQNMEVIYYQIIRMILYYI